MPVPDIFFRGEDANIEHGTLKGYRQEYKLGLDRCDACRKAYSADRLARKHAQKQREREADEEFEAALAAENEEVVSTPSPVLARFAHAFVPNEFDPEDYGILPLEHGGVAVVETEEPEEEFANVSEILPYLNEAQQVAAGILAEKYQKLFSHLVFQHLTLACDIDEEAATEVADAPFLFGEYGEDDD